MRWFAALPLTLRKPTPAQSAGAADGGGEVRDATTIRANGSGVAGPRRIFLRAGRSRTNADSRRGRRKFHDLPSGLPQDASGGGTIYQPILRVEHGSPASAERRVLPCGRSPLRLYLEADWHAGDRWQREEGSAGRLR